MYFDEETGFYVVILDDRVKMKPFFRKSGELFSEAAIRATNELGLVVAINSSFYDVDYLHAGLAYSTGKPQDPEFSRITGTVRIGGVTVMGSEEKQKFFIAQRLDSYGPVNNYRNFFGYYLDRQGLYEPIVKIQSGEYIFGFGDGVSGEFVSVSGLGPLIIDGLRYGERNFYSPLVPKGAPFKGPPGPEFAPYLQIRSNNTFKSTLGFEPESGRIAIAHSKIGKKIAILLKQDGVNGIDYGVLREKLFRKGFENAVFLDGSDSVLLYIDGVFISQQEKNKNRLTPVGIGFSYE